MEWYLMGFVSLLLFVVLTITTVMKVIKNYKDRKRAGLSRPAFFSIVSLLVVIGSLVCLGTAALRLPDSADASNEATVLLAISSWLLTVGFASIVYYEQVIENQMTTHKIETVLQELLASNQAVAASLSKTSPGTTETGDPDTIRLKNEIKIMMLEQIKLDIQHELEGASHSDVPDSGQEHE